MTIPRTDGGSKRLIACRSWVNGGAQLQLRGNSNGSDDFTNWATRTDGRMRRTRKAAGNYASISQTTVTANQVAGCSNESPLLGFIFGARGRVINEMHFGDSIDDGRGTYKGDGFMAPAVAAMNGYNGVIYCSSNMAWAGHQSVNFYFHVSDAFAAGLIPDLACWPIGSPNDFTGTLSGVAITGTGGQFSCNAATMAVDQQIVISGALGGTGSITGYANPTAYYIVGPAKPPQPA